MPRRGLLVDLEDQLGLAGAGSGLVLVGRRRTGKSTLLHNLAAQVKSAAEVVVISMQSARAFSSLASLQSLLRQGLASRLSADELPAAGGDLASCERLLAVADRLLARERRKLVLAIDEYEGIDLKIAAGIFPEDLLALLRDSMRSHRHLCWLFAGSRSVEELDGARWTSYFVGTRLLQMPLFELAETRELLTEPLKSSSVFAGAAGREPVFPAAFWGAGASSGSTAKPEAGPTWCSCWRRTRCNWSTRRAAPGSIPRFSNGFAPKPSAKAVWSSPSCWKKKAATPANGATCAASATPKPRKRPPTTRSAAPSAAAGCWRTPRAIAAACARP